jgi:hypothetical protein
MIGRLCFLCLVLALAGCGGGGSDDECVYNLQGSTSDREQAQWYSYCRGDEYEKI